MQVMCFFCYWYICLGNHFKTVATKNDVPQNIVDVLSKAMAINSAYTSRILVCLTALQVYLLNS